MTKPRNTEIRRYLLARDGAERVRITKDGDCHIYGRMPNTNTIGWYFAGAVCEVRRELRAEQARAAA